MILASATDISTGSRFVFSQRVFDVICSDLDAVPLSRAAAASSAVPVVLSPVTHQQLWWHLRQRHARLAEALSRRRQPAAAGGAGDPLAASAEESLPRQRPSALPASGRRRRVGQRGHARACSMRWRSSRRCTKPACHRRSTARAGSSSSSSIRCRRRRPTGTCRRARRARWTCCSRRPARRSTPSPTRRWNCCGTRRRAGRRCAGSAIRRPWPPTRTRRSPPRCACPTPRSTPSTCRSRR